MAIISDFAFLSTLESDLVSLLPGKKVMPFLHLCCWGQNLPLQWLTIRAHLLVPGLSSCTSSLPIELSYSNLCTTQFLTGKHQSNPLRLVHTINLIH
jgi:hypothetical protein